MRRLLVLGHASYCAGYLILEDQRVKHATHQLLLLFGQPRKERLRYRVTLERQPLHLNLLSL